MCIFGFSVSTMSAQIFDSVQVVLNNTLYDLAKSRVSPPPVLLYAGANLGTFNPSIGQTLTLKKRQVNFKNSTSCQVQSMTFSYELYKDIAAPVLVASGSGINVPLDLNIPPISVWKILTVANDIALVTASTPNGDYTLKLKYDYVFSFGPVCMAGGMGSTGWVDATFGVLNTPLAVEMSTFSARKQSNKEIALLWKTAKEENNNAFAIERSSDGVDFKTIGNVKGASVSSIEKSYNFSDAAPLQGINYYRIRSVATDGKEAMSKVVSVNFSEKINKVLQVYPNPTHAALQVEVTADEEVAKTLQVFDLAGRIILTQNAVLTKGLNNISLNTDALSAGTYLVKLGSEMSRFVKM